MEELKTNQDLFVFLRKNSFDSNALYQKVLASVNVETEANKKTLKNTVLGTQVGNIKKRWKSANSTAENFTRKYADWLEFEVKWPAFVQNRTGRDSDNQEIESRTEATECSPSTSFDSPVSRSTSQHESTEKIITLTPLEKQRKIVNLVANNDFETLADALIRKAGENESQKDVAEVIRHVIRHPEDAAVLRACVKTKQRGICEDETE